MGFLLYNPDYILLVMIPTLLISAGAQMYIQRSFARWGQVRNSRGVTGAQTATTLIRAEHLGETFPPRSDCRAVEGTGLCLAPIAGSLTDHYDPRSRIVRLSESVAGVNSVAAMAVAAHELGHVQQHETGSALIKMRNILVPAMRISPNTSYILLMLGFFLGSTGLISLGIMIFGLTVLFALLTVPVELDASRRAIKMLQETGVATTEDDINGARAVLRAAALTYVAAAVTAVIQLLYLISRMQRRRR